jgi:predicted site-specific integrase-resolvase
MRMRLVTPNHAALRLGVHLETFRRWIRAEKVTPAAVHNIGSKRWPRYRVEEKELDRILAEGLLDPASKG